jgi:hypothetical protein
MGNANCTNCSQCKGEEGEHAEILTVDNKVRLQFLTFFRFSTEQPS